MNQVCRHATRGSLGYLRAISLFSAVFLGQVCVAQELSADVDRYELIGNTLLSPAQVESAISGATGKLTLADIQKTAQRLQEAYRKAGFGAVVVQVPQQTLDKRVVQLEVIEGKLSQIQVAGIRQLSRANILRSLPALVLNKTPLLSELDSELLMVNENPAKALRVVFQPGEKKGQVEALVVVQEQPIERWNMLLDSTGNDDTGNYRLALSYQNANFRDADYVVGLRLVTSPSNPSQVAILSTTLRVPMYRQKIFWEWSALASNTRNAPNQTPAGELRFAGEGLSVGARAIWTLPSLSEYKQQASIGMESRQYRNSCTIGEFGSAGCGTAAASVDVLPLTLGYAVQKAGAFNASVQWVSNLPVGNAGNDADFDASRPGAVSRYNLVRANATGNAAINRDWAFSWRADLQLAGQPLVSAEQFGAGGTYTVRGYPERALSGDSGAMISGELSTAFNHLIGKDDAEQNLRLAWFVDAATVSNQFDTACMAGKTTCTVWGTGAALHWRSGKGTSARIDLARAGEAVNTTHAGDWRLHLNLSHQF
jgi:hemolysin activation/secretion protein